MRAGWQYTYMSCTCTTQIQWHEISCVMLRTDKGNIIRPASVMCSGFGSVFHMTCGRKCDMSCWEECEVDKKCHVHVLLVSCKRKCHFWSSATHNVQDLSIFLLCIFVKAFHTFHRNTFEYFFSIKFTMKSETVTSINNSMLLSLLVFSIRFGLKCKVY